MQSDLSPLPLRGNDAIEILLNDHQVIKSLLSRLTQAGQASQRKQVLDQLKAALTIHNATEENLVYPALEKVAGKKTEAQKLYHETAAADVLIFELDTMLKEGDDSDFDAKAEKLQGAVLEHIEDEEDSAFPHIQEKAEPEESQMLTESVREFRNSFRFEMAGGARAGRSETGEISGQTSQRRATE